MRLDRDGTIVLSRRNLLTLLAKLDHHPVDSFCTIAGGSEAPGIVIRAEEDTLHYERRVPGLMHPDTEEAIARK